MTTASLTGTSADVTAEPTAQQRLDALTSDPKWRQQLLAGGGAQLRELQEALTARSSGGDQLDQIIAGTARDSEIETVHGGALSTHKQMIAAASLREAGIPDASIRQILDGKPVSKAEYDAVSKLKADLLSDAEFTKKWLAGDRQTQIKMTQIGIVLAGGFKDAA